MLTENTMFLVRPETDPSEANIGMLQPYSTDLVKPSLNTASIDSTESVRKVSIILSETIVSSSNHP